MSAAARLYHLCLAIALISAVALTSCNSRTDNDGKEPRVTVIPLQSSEGGVVFSLDLTQWVSDPNHGLLEFTVNEGGGSVVDGVYHNVFDTVGAKTVKLTATNDIGTVDFSFVVLIETGYQAVIQAGSGLVMLDRSTVSRAPEWTTGSPYSSHFIRVSNSPGYQDTFKAALRPGQVVYERLHGTQLDLYLFDAFQPDTVRLGDDPNFETDEVFEGVTTDYRIVFTVRSATEVDLYVYNVMTGLTREISAAKDVFEGNVVIDANDDIYFETGPSAQRDIYVYRPSKDELAPVSVADENEAIVAATATGGIVYTRDEGAGDVDLWFFNSGVGHAQVAADVLTSGFQDRILTYNDSTPGGRVVFTETVSATDTNLYCWDPVTLTTTVIAANSGDHDVYNVTTSAGDIIYTHKVSATDWDIHSRPVGGVDEDLSRTGEKDMFQAITGLDDLVIFRGETAMYIYDQDISTLLAADAGGSGALTFEASLEGGNVLYSRDGVGLHRWETTNWRKLVHADAVYCGSIYNGTDFVIRTTDTGQGDLYVWREADDSLEVVTDNGADERFVVSTTLGNGLVFSRQGPGANYDLFVWGRAAGVRKVSGTDSSHTLVGTFFLDRR